MPYSGYDPTLAASDYSAVAGIIAGFAFAALVWLVERLTPGEDYSESDDLTVRALALLGISFLGNVLAAFLFARVAGQTDPAANRTSILSYLTGTTFSLFTSLTVESLVLIVATSYTRGVVWLFRAIFVFSLVINAAFQASSTVGLLASQAGGSIAVSQHSAGFIVGGVCLALIAFSLWISQRPRGGRFGLDSIQSFRSFVVGCLAVATVYGGLTVVMSNLAPDTHLPDGLIAAVSVSSALLIAWGIVFVPAEAMLGTKTK